MAPADQQATTQVFVNVGKSIAAFERTIRGAGSPLDADASGDSTALTDPQKDGLLAFFQAGCAQCHYGPRLTDDAFHVLRFPAGRGLEGGRRPGADDGIPLLSSAASSAQGAPGASDPSQARRPPPRVRGHSARSRLRSSRTSRSRPPTGTAETTPSSPT